MTSDVAHTIDERPTVGVSRDSLLWLCVALVAIGDIVTTAYGLHIGLNESNPVAFGLLEEFGFVSLILLKATVIAIGYAGYLIVPERVQWFVPSCYLFLWGIALANNAALLLWVTFA